MPYEKIGKNEPVCIADEVPFEIPESWEWVRLGNYAEKVTDQVASGSFASLRENVPSLKEPNYAIMVKTADFSNGFTRNLTYTTKQGYEFLANSNLFGGELILSNIGSIGKCSIVPKLNCKMTLAPNSIMIRLTDEFLRDYLYNFILSPQGFEELNEITSGTAMKKFNKTDLKRILIPVPPVNEQKRIVNKLQEIKHLTDKYKELEDNSTRLNTDFPNLLKKSILQYAVQGELVPQDSADEPASVLLEHIRAEKEQLIKSGKIKRDKHESVIFRRDNSYYERVDGIERCIDDEIPFEIPDNWEWCRLKSLTERITSGSRDWAKYYSTTGAVFLRMGNLSRNSFNLRLEHIQRVSIPSKAEGTRTALQGGDLLFSITGDVGMLGLIPVGFEEAYINQHTAMIRFLPSIRNEYIPYLLLTDYAQKFYNENQHGIKNSFRLDSIGELFVPVPPEKEITRILQKITHILSQIALL